MQYAGSLCEGKKIIEFFVWYVELVFGSLHAEGNCDSCLLLKLVGRKRISAFFFQIEK
jgi:hypothetical protein